MNRLDGIELDQILEHAGDGVFVIGADGKILLWNRASEKIMGYTAREALRRPCCDVFAGRDDNDNRLCYQGCHVVSLAGLGEPVQNFDMRTRTKGGQTIWLNVSVLRVPNGRSNGALTVHMIRDVTATKELLSLVHERLAEANGRQSAPDAEHSLTRRELEVLRVVSEGLRTKEAAERLHVSPATVRNHVQNILNRLGVHSRLEAVAYAHRHRLI
ncbi:MAG: PAS domain S-box protein [Candidatus Rokubacteria bacterium]|nr:PAS domain S-box protein [Candidatus Rokubacteria bacterium]MBI4593847.1 PAS domain S-box protein [Candidatus Rokubacteria bacterium]